ncbi:MAG: hypothetical protein PHH82_04465 [Candidatus ainarchaeum sp.]|nr:hypothetical protein [Candidatus ainarchaeum sp.]
MDSFFENFGYEYCVDSFCISNDKIGKNKVVKTSKIFFEDLEKKQVSITVFYD